MHIDDKKKHILILGKGLPGGLHDTMLTAEKQKQQQKKQNNRKKL